MSHISNPIIPGFAPDPSIVHVDGLFFLVMSSFHLFPGLPIYASKDLVSWEHIGNAFNRRSQLALSKSPTRLSPPAPETGKTLPATAGLYAPTIRHRAGRFYIVCTNAIFQKDRGVVDKHNFILSTTDIWAGTWSDPVYVTGSATPGPWTKIRCFEIDTETGEKLSEERTLWTGTGGVYPEGPHLYKRKGWFYLVIAEGGTHVTHSLTVARSKDLWGPYEACPGNPVLTARGTDEYVQHVGHADLFEDEDGRWWAVFELRNDAQRIHRTCRRRLEPTGGSVAVGMQYTEKQFRVVYSTESRLTGPWIEVDVVDALEVSDMDFVGPVLGVFVVVEREVEVEFKGFYCN